MVNVSKTKRAIAEELHKPARRNFKRRRTIIKGFADLWQADLAEMQPYSKENNGNRYILMVIDCYSKYLWVKPLKTKTSGDVYSAMQQILQEATDTPKLLQTDNGTEFYNKHFSRLMKKYGINHYSTYSTKKAAIVERVIRTIKSWLYKEFSARGRNKWIDILDDLIKKYNGKVHRTTGMRPIDIHRNTLLTVYDYPKLKLRAKFKVNDIVRISKHKAIFDKGYTPNYSTELFKIKKVNVTNPITYLLEDMDGQPIKGCFYQMELQKTHFPTTYLVEKVLKSKGDRLFVKWLGFPNDQNSWIHKNSIV
jgi:Integrase core domain